MILDTFGKVKEITNKEMISKTFDVKKPVPHNNDNN
jgi:hypothetical protein